MTRIIIQHESDIAFSVAARHVDSVMQMGFVSEAHGIPQYCFASTFMDGIEVFTRERQYLHSAHSFIVRRVEPAQ